MKMLAFVLSVVLLAPGLLAQGPSYSVIDSAPVIEISPGRFVVYPVAWATQDARAPQKAFYINGQYATAGIRSDRSDVCAVMRQAGFKCDEDQNQACVGGPNGTKMTMGCVGMFAAIDITSLPSGTHLLQVCMTHSENTSTLPVRVCPFSKSFVRP